ncbi:hypothetical protein FRC11_000073, partial [Ceratobasidium sp. 423]
MAAGLLCTMLLLASQSHPSQGLNFMSRPRLMSVRQKLERQEDAYAQTVQDRHAFIRKVGPTPDQVVPYPDESSYKTYTLWDFFPASFNCPHETSRLGVMGDGGKWVCGLSKLINKPNCVVYSAGINVESSFEADIIRRTKCEVFGFDFSVDKFGPEIENFANLRERTHFYKYAISGKDDHHANPPAWTLQSLMERHGHTFIDILKVDIESAEFDVLGETVRYYKDRNLPLPFGQLQLEIHSENVPFDKFLKWWEDLEAAGLRPFHTETNLIVVSWYRTKPKRPPSPTPRLHYRHDQEAIEMDVIAGGLDSKSISTAGAPEVPAWTMSPKKEWAAIATCCGCLFMSGWNDAATGPLLPTIQAHYNIGFIIVSMLFVSNCVGYLSAAVINIHLTDRLGLGKITLLGGMLQILAYSMLAPAPPFPVMCISYALNGFGVALHNAQANGFVAELPKNTSAKLGLLHAGYGECAGAFAAPFVATQFAQMPRWSLYYLTSIGLSLINSLAIFFVFKLRRQHEVMELPAPQVDTSRNDENAYKAVFSSRAAQLLAIFSWVYVGTEVTVGGWIVTFIIEERGGGASSGYVSSGFFGGLMLRRVALLWINKRIGERRVIYLYSVIAIALQLVIWLVPDIIGNAVAVSFVGLLLGPMFPIIMKVTSELVPKRILTGCIGWIASSGQVGSAVFPFMTGALAQKHGVKVLQP